MNTTTSMVVGIFILLILGGTLWYTASDRSEMSTTTPNGASAPEQGAVSSVQLAFLDTTGEGGSKERGCDSVVMVPWQIATTTAPLTAALRALFSIPTTSVEGWFNYIDRTNETLKFDHATVEEGTANIFLTGSLSGLAGVCDDPRAQIQIEETALQFPTVRRVHLYLNGEPTTLIPSQK